MDTLCEHLKRIAPLGGKARWKGTTKKERKEHSRFINSKKKHGKTRGGEK